MMLLFFLCKATTVTISNDCCCLFRYAGRTCPSVDMLGCGRCSACGRDQDGSGRVGWRPSGRNEQKVVSVYTIAKLDHAAPGARFGESVSWSVFLNNALFLAHFE